MKEVYEKFRRHLESTISVSDQEWEQIVPCFTLRSWNKGEVLVPFGQLVDHDHWVASGCFKAGYLDFTGKEHILQFAIENWWISDYNAFFKGVKSQMTIDCLETGVVLQISSTDRERLCREVPAVEKFFLKKITYGFVALQNRVLSILSNNPREQYEEFLRLYPELSQSISKKYIAGYLGVSRETLSRLYS